MATKADATLIPSNDTTAKIRAWATFIEDLIVTTGGWTHTTEAGETAPGALAVPGGANTKVGFRVYHMNDALQASTPVYMRVDFGSGGSANVPAFWITFGTGSDGSGNITGSKMAVTQFAANTNSTTQITNNWGSASTGHVVWGMFNFTSNVGQLCFGVQRTVDVNGDPTTDGLIVLGSKAGGIAGFSQFVNYQGIVNPGLEPGWSYILSGNNPSAFSSNTGIALIIPFAGSALQPGLIFGVVRSSDFVSGATFAVTAYGGSHTYQCLAVLNASITNGTSSATDAQSRICILYE